MTNENKTKETKQKRKHQNIKRHINDEINTKLKTKTIYHNLSEVKQENLKRK